MSGGKNSMEFLIFFSRSQHKQQVFPSAPKNDFAGEKVKLNSGFAFIFHPKAEGSSTSKKQLRSWWGSCIQNSILNVYQITLFSWLCFYIAKYGDSFIFSFCSYNLFSLFKTLRKIITKDAVEQEQYCLYILGHPTYENNMPLSFP